MNIKLFLSLLLLCAMTFPAQTKVSRQTVNQPKPVAARADADAVNQLPIRRVILYSNGVAYVERRGIVAGNAEINLSFKQSQVDDVLKSMVVLDLGQGRIGAVSYNSSAPVASRMAEIPFSVSPLTGEGGGLAAVLAQLQGAKVAVTSPKGAATGAILTVERKQIKTEKETLATSVLVIASENGEISSFDLNDVKSVKLLDEGTQKDLNEFANASASTRRRDAKTITITSNGAGQREMIVSYTIAAPIWKTTYRVVLDEAGKPFFQGWAIVDNISEEDWENVQLSLVSGSPISFIQQLQKPFYRYRPVVPTPQDLQLQPQVYEPQSGVLNTTESKISTNITSQQVQNLPLNGRQTLSLAQLQPGVTSNGFQSNGASGGQNNFIVDGQELNNFRTGNLNSNNNIAVSSTTVSDALLSNSNGVETNTKGEEIGDLFEYRIEQPVTVLRDRSALIPIVQTKMDGERVAVYNEAVRRDRPYSGVLLKNLTPLTLEAGSLTVIDGNAYAGEALMERLKAKEQRLISFALDLGTNVRVRTNEDREPAKIVKVVNGVFQVHYFRTSEKLYQIANQTERPKVLYIEYPVQDGWVLSETGIQPDYTTQRYYRFRVELKGFEEKEVKIAVRQPLMDGYQLTSISKTDLQLFVTQKYINEETRARMEKLIDLRSRIAEIEARLDSFDDEVEKIEADQKRLRENIEALSKTPEAKTLITRYIAKADEQETRLENMEKERKTLEAEKQKLEQELGLEIRAFQITK
ncbi:MAG: hypothetical protein JSS81_25190 [Acidobacteria bacterium]|nr:hypothetical protein [Acidobacteriota bacterium]